MNFDESAAKMRGAFSAIFTPFDSNNRVCLETLSRIAEFQLSHGIKGFFATGSTGEGLLLSYEERLSVIRHLAENFGQRATVIAHVGHPSTDFATKLARDAADAGAKWIASVAPIYHGTTFDGAMRHYSQISNATDLPFMIYSIGANVEPERDRRFFELPHVCGLKYTGANFYSVQQLARLVDRPIALMSGFDEQFVAGQSFGFSGGIGSTYNFAPQFYADIFRHYHAGEIHKAAKVQETVNRLTNLVVESENWSYRKAVMKYLGLDCGACRPPYAPLTDKEYDDFAKRLNELDVIRPVSSTGTVQA